MGKIRRGSKYEPNASIGEFDPANPWAYLWWMATDPDSPSTAEWYYWENSFAKQAQQISNGVVSIDYYLDGEFAVASTPKQHFALAHDAKAILGKGAGQGSGDGALGHWRRWLGAWWQSTEQGRDQTQRRGQEA